MAKIKVVALYGKAGSGKDTVLRELIQSNIEYNFHEIISCTTRPPREGEINHINYHFLTNEEFTEQVLNGDMLEATEFNNWFYGTPMLSLDPNKINIGVFNIAGLEALIEDPRIEVLPIEIWAPDKERLLRQLNREEKPNVEEICRRFFADKKDFDEWEATREIEWEESIFYAKNDEGALHLVVSMLSNLIIDFSRDLYNGL